MEGQHRVVSLSSGEWNALVYLNHAHQVGASIVGERERSQGTQILRLRPEKQLGGAFAELGSYVFDAGVRRIYQRAAPRASVPSSFRADGGGGEDYPAIRERAS